MLRSPNRAMGLVLGALFALFGLVGFTATAGIGFAASPGGAFLGLFEVNPLQNLIHVVLGAALLVAALRGVRAASTTNSIVGAVLLVLGLASLFLVGSTANVVAVNVADNALHFGGAAVLLAVGLGADQRTSA